MENSFGNFLSIKRKEMNLTQKELADKLFVTESAVSKWERNKTKPDIELVGEISKILNVSEHELITASVDNERTKERQQAKKWKNLTLTYDYIFYLGYFLAVLTCFIVNLATKGTLDWFFIVLSAIALSFSLTSLPKLIKSYKLLILSITPLILLIILFGICNIYTKGSWFLIASLPVLFAFVIVFLPIYIQKYNFPTLIKKHTSIFCFITDLIMLLLLLLYCETYTNGNWYIKTALPITLVCSTLPLLFITIFSYINLNKSIKTSLCLLCSSIFVMLVTPFIIKNVETNFNVAVENYNKINLLKWNQEFINGNVKLLIFLSLITLTIIFGVFGIVKLFKKK